MFVPLHIQVISLGCFLAIWHHKGQEAVVFQIIGFMVHFWCRECVKKCDKAQPLAY